MTIFDDYSDTEADLIFQFPFSQLGPLRFNSINSVDIKDCPLIRYCIYISEYYQEYKVIKLTKAGFLPLKTVEELLTKNNNFLQKQPLKKKFREEEVKYLLTTRLFLSEEGYLTNVNNLLLLPDNKLTSIHERLAELYYSFFSFAIARLDWDALLGMKTENIPLLSAAFSILYVRKYGNTPRPASFYYKKAIIAIEHFYPDLFSEETLINTEFHYETQTFRFFLQILGLVKPCADYPAKWIATPLCFKVFEILPNRIYFKWKINNEIAD